MTIGKKRFYAFGPYQLDIEKRVLYRDDKLLDLQLKTFEVLFALIKHSNEVVTKDELLAEAWPKTTVDESNVGQQIHKLTHLLGTQPDGKPYIQTIHKRGYRFIAEVTAPDSKESL